MERLEHPVQLCIYMFNHNVTQSSLSTWTHPPTKTNIKKKSFSCSCLFTWTSFIFCLTQQKQKAFFPPQYWTFFAKHTSTEMYIHTPAHNNFRIPPIALPGNASPYWCSPFSLACDSARQVFADHIPRNTMVFCSVWTLHFSRICEICIGWDMFGDYFYEFKTMVIHDN